MHKHSEALVEELGRRMGGGAPVDKTNFRGFQTTNYRVLTVVFSGNGAVLESGGPPPPGG
ncbi:hypothetical protein EYF80_038031 [Liparis tanakae]|uniref:Uncharacterized protein n=1 Tax=Liparis tanakae TaxID=230148 RepID=A0A4Z2GEN7_9TELE|nr:hypothetical protein EYF80_038031 [Liparis tanakae]